MASIFGFSIKNIKTFRGREWDGCQGDICYNGKKVGWYNDSGNGGCADIDFDGSYDERKRYMELLEQATQKYFDRFPIKGMFACVSPDADIFMGALCDLTFDEQLYKRYAKQGKPFMVTFEVGNIGKIAASETDKVFDMIDVMADATEVCKYRCLQDFEIK